MMFLLLKEFQVHIDKIFYFRKFITRSFSKVPLNFTLPSLFVWRLFFLLFETFFDNSIFKFGLKVFSNIFSSKIYLNFDFYKSTFLVDVQNLEFLLKEQPETIKPIKKKIKTLFT